MRLTKFLLLLQWSTQRTELLSKGWILIINVALPFSSALPSCWDCTSQFLEVKWGHVTRAGWWSFNYWSLRTSSPWLFHHPWSSSDIMMQRSPQGKPWRPWSRRKKALFSAVNILGLSVSAANFNSIGDVDCYFWESLWFIFYFLLLFALIFFFCWPLFPGHKFLSFQFLLGYLLLLCSLLFWFREDLLFFSKDHFSVARLIRPWAL